MCVFVITELNVYIPNNRILKCMKQKLTELKSKTENSTIKCGSYTSPSVTDKKDLINSIY